MDDIIELSSSDSDDTIILPQNVDFCENEEDSDINSIVNKYILGPEKNSSEDKIAETAFKNFDKYNVLDEEFSDDGLIALPLHKRLKETSDSTKCPKYSDPVLESFSSNPANDELVTNITTTSGNSVNKLSEKTKKQLEQHQARLEKMRERQKKIEEQNMEKCLKRAASEANKNIKPGECMKFILVYIDDAIVNEEYGQKLFETLQLEDIAYKVQSQIFPNTISWVRKIQSHLINHNKQLTLSEEERETEQILLLLNSQEFVQHVKNNTLCSYIQSLKSVFVNKRIFLVVFGLRSYLRYFKNQGNREYRSVIGEEGGKSKGPAKYHKYFKDLPKVSKADILSELTELQLLCSCSSRLVEKVDELILTVLQFTKSIATLPFKAQQREKQQQTEWYAQGENKDCVKVDAAGNGLQRLWKQVLTTFPLASLETAEAIIAQYPTQLSLMEAYDNCISKKDAESLLKEICIRRAAGPLVSVRKIGPELSKKIYNYLTSTDEDSFL